jgi:lipooligosaccharide transport system permease protein
MATPVALRVLEGHARSYRHTWRGTTMSSIVTPVLFLAAMGLGLGTLVDGGERGGVDGLAYLTWLAPGLLAGSAMQNGAGDGAFPVMAGIRWAKTYHSALATPVRPMDLMLGNLGWAAIRLTVAALAYALVAVAFGALPLGRALLAVVPAVVTGLAFCANVSALTARLKNEQGLTAMFRFGVMPLFLFSGTFFPVSGLPDPIQPLVQVVPLWHGVELTRAVAVGTDPAGPWVLHAAVVVGFLLVGVVLAAASFDRRLRT